ncbi:MAG: hypothetical protein ACR2RE_18420 [Geminicoccaceae bacterium]
MRKPETVCRMLCARNSMGAGGCPDCDEIDGCKDWPEYADDYRTVLAGIRMATPGQLEAAQRELVNLTWSWKGGRPKHSQLKHVASEIWRAMVDQLLEESGTNGQPVKNESVERRAAEAQFAAATK